MFFKGNIVKSVQRSTCVFSVLLLSSICVSCSTNLPGDSKPRAATGASGGDAGDMKLQGTGASFPAPLYNKWFKAYSAAHQNVLVDYQSVGSGSGVKSVIAHT